MENKISIFDFYNDEAQRLANFCTKMYKQSSEEQTPAVWKYKYAAHSFSPETSLDDMTKFAKEMVENLKARVGVNAVKKADEILMSGEKKDDS